MRNAVYALLTLAALAFLPAMGIEITKEGPPASLLFHGDGGGP